jgi:hypothetical protein
MPPVFTKLLKVNYKPIKPLCDSPFVIKNNIGIDNIVLVRDAKKAILLAAVFSASLAGFKPRIFC